MIPNHAPPLRVPADRPATRGRIAVDGAVLVGALALFSLVAWQMAPFVPDDSFISYRYAANLAGGSGLRFNPADAPVEGYSNFLWIVLLAMSAISGVDPASSGILLGGLLGMGCIVVLWLILRRRGRSGPALAVPMALIAMSGPFVLYVVSGMETALYTLLLLVGILAADILLARPTIARGLGLGAVGALTALARPEGIVAFPVIVVCLLFFERRNRTMWAAALAGAALFVATLTAYHLWRIDYFGAFWPTPFLSKGASGGSFVDPWFVNARQFFLRQTHYYAPMGYYYLALGAMAALAVALGGRKPARGVESTALMLALVYAVVYVNFIDWMPGMRYYAPLAPLLLIPFSALAEETRGAAEGWRANSAFVMVGLMLALFSIFSLAALRLDSQQLQVNTQASAVELGHWLRRTMPPDAVLAMSDVGATPYFSGLHTIDINPESLTDRHIAENGWSADYFFDVNPDVVAITAFSLTKPDFYGVYEELYSLPRFQSTYERIGVVRNDWYQDRSYWVFVRKGMSPTPEQMATFPVGIHKP